MFCDTKHDVLCPQMFSAFWFGGVTTVVVNIPDDYTSKQSEGVKEWATKLLCEPKEEIEDPIAFSESIFGVDLSIAHKDSLVPPFLLLTREGAIRDSASILSNDIDHICGRMGDYLGVSSHTAHSGVRLGFPCFSPATIKAL